MDIKVAVIEDDPRYRHSLEELLANTDGFSLAASFGSAYAALEKIDKSERDGKRLDWHLVLMDLELPGMDGIEATRRLKTLVPELTVVVLTVFEETTTILKAICAGADGYLLKKSSAPELILHLRSAASGGSPLTAGVARMLLDLVRKLDSETAGEIDSVTPKRLALTEREQEVLQCLVRGMSYKQIAAHLDISLDTVRDHIRNTYKKLQVHNVAEAIVRAIRDRLV